MRPVRVRRDYKVTPVCHFCNTRSRVFIYYHELDDVLWRCADREDELMYTCLGAFQHAILSVGHRGRPIQNGPAEKEFSSSQPHGQ
jgi:hypothetical protein